MPSVQGCQPEIMLIHGSYSIVSGDILGCLKEDSGVLPASRVTEARNASEHPVMHQCPPTQ